MSTAENRPRRRVHLAAHFPGVNNETVWSDPVRSGSNIAVESFVRMARDAEEGLMDFLFLAEGLRLREQGGQIHDLDVVGRPDTLTMLSAVLGATDHIGVAGTLTATYHEPYELARQLATMDHLSGGRTAWNVVTSPDAFTGENFRRGGYLPYEQRYERAVDFIQAARTMWESWPLDPAQTGPDAGRFVHRSEFFDLEGRFGVPRSPQVHPVVMQAGDSPSGRDFAAGSADLIFTRHSGPENGRAFRDDIRSRLTAIGRDPDEIQIYPGVSFVIGDTEEDAQEKSLELAWAQHSGATALATASRLWNMDLSERDPDDPVPDFDPVVDGPQLSQGRVNHYPDPMGTAEAWRELGRRNGWSLRKVVSVVDSRHHFVGTPRSIAEAMSREVDQGAADGFILVPAYVPGGFREVVDRVVPELQEMGVYPDHHEPATLRQRLGLPEHRPAEQWAALRDGQAAAASDAAAAAQQSQEA